MASKKNIFKSRVYHILNRIVSIKKDESKGIIKYDVDNLFPQNLIKQVSESGTATSCVEALNQYSFADGLVDEDLGKIKANEKQTFNELIDEIFKYISIFQAYAIYITRDMSGGIKYVSCLPFENIRKTINGTFYYNPTYSCGKVDDSKKTEYPAYRGPKITTEQLAKHVADYGKDRGEILYFFSKKPGQYDYPIPSYYSAISDIETDSENSKYELESVNNSFLPSGILTFVGDIDDEEEDETGRTEWDYNDETIQAFTGNVKDENGRSGRQKLAVFQAKTKEEIPYYQQINNEGILTAIDSSTKRVAGKVARAFGVPPFLIGLDGNVGFATNIISDNIALFNNRVKISQNLASNGLKLCFPEKDFSMTQLNPVKYIATEVYAKLTDSELRELAGYKTDETKSKTTVSLAQTLGVGGTQSLVSILQDTALTPDQKTNSLVILFNISQEDAIKLVGTNAVQSSNN